jgi:hypothetical protein
MSVDTPGAWFVCPQCGKHHPWTPGFAGRSGRCPCGNAMTTPRMPEISLSDAQTAPEALPASDAPQTAEILMPGEHPSSQAPVALPAASAGPTPAPSPGAAPTISAPTSYSATGIYEIDDSAYEIDSMLAIAPGTDFTSGTDFPPGIELAELPATQQAPPSAGFPPSRPSALASKSGAHPNPHDAPHASPWRDLAAPLVLILLGVVLCVCDAMYQGPDAPMTPVGQAIAAAAEQMGISAALVIAAAAIASMIGGVAFPDAPPTTALKMIAVSLAPGALASIAGHYIGDSAAGGINGQICYSLLSVALFAALIWTLFRMHVSDTVICVALIWIIRTGMLYFLFRFQGAKTGSAI